MKLSTRVAATVLAAGVVTGATACGTGYNSYASATYCVNEATGTVMPPEYCQVGNAYYNPLLYDFWIGSTYGHSYRTGTVINHNYFSSGKQVNPSSSTARKAAGLPASGKVSNGTKTNSSTPAKSQTSPSSKVGSSTGKSSTSTSKVGGSSSSKVGGSSSRSGGFSSGFGSSKSSGGGFSSSRSSSGGRK